METARYWDRSEKEYASSFLRSMSTCVRVSVCVHVFVGESER